MDFRLVVVRVHIARADDQLEPRARGRLHREDLLERNRLAGLQGRHRHRGQRYHLGALAPGRLHTIVTGRDRWAATRSVAKALGPDLRLAVLTGDPLTVARVEGRQRCGPGWVSHILQQLVLELWSDPAVIALVERAGATYARRRERFLGHLAAHGIGASGRSGLNVWVPVEDETATVGALLQRGWVVAPGAAYRLPGSAPAVRVTISMLSAPESQRLAADLGEILAGASSTRTG